MLETIQTLHSECIDRLDALTDTTERDAICMEMPDKISVILGMRRVGKTYFMLHKIKQLLSEDVPASAILYVDFEDDRLLPLDQSKLASILDDFYSLFPDNHQRMCYLFLDEIQVIEGWALVIRRFHNTKKIRFYLSGSSAKLLSKEIATELRGRAVSTELFPFSFHEYLKTQHIQAPSGPLSKKAEDRYTTHLLQYLEEGGFPGVIGQNRMQQTLVLQDYIDVVLFRDIIERHKITNVSVVKYMIHYLLCNFSTSLSTNKFYNDLKSQGFAVGRSSVYDYLSYIEDAYLIFTVPIYAESIRKVQNNPKKMYAIDNGMVHANTLNRLKNYGRAFENLVYLDLRRSGAVIYYYVTQEGYEVDFLVKHLSGELALYQVCFDPADEKTFNREMRALTTAEKELGVKGTLITIKNYMGLCSSGYLPGWNG
ncbi:MAG: ATP-binding protein [Gammaproteobacteria bacterium]|nr:ATP-binding protein [Gammaproteobacteria bacterium]